MSKTIIPLLILLGLIVLVVTFARERVRGIKTDLTPAEIMSMVNAARQQHGLKPLHPQPSLMRAAEAKANAMMAADAWSHSTPTQSPWQFLEAEEYIYSLAGENLAKDFTSAQDVINAWLNSPSHRDNMLNPEFSETGVAVIEGNYQGKEQTTLIVQYLAKAYTGTEEILTDTNFLQAPMLAGKISAINPLSFIIFSTLAIIASGAGVIMLFLKRKQVSSVPPSSHWRK